MAAHSVISPMTGRVVEIPVRVGEFVDKGDMVLVIESMKMENEIKAPRDGTVKSVEVTAGQIVQQGQKLETEQTCWLDNPTTYCMMCN